jgi:hypothetical protein
MKTTLAQPEARTSNASVTSGAPSWEYCFLLQDNSNPTGGDLIQLTSAGWSIVSFRTRFDSQREYLLKRPRT